MNDLNKHYWLKGGWISPTRAATRTEIEEEQEEGQRVVARLVVG
jgi:hypothetical protein